MLGDEEPVEAAQREEVIGAGDGLDPPGGFVQQPGSDMERGHAAQAHRGMSFCQPATEALHMRCVRVHRCLLSVLQQSEVRLIRNEESGLVDDLVTKATHWHRSYFTRTTFYDLVRRGATFLTAGRP